MLYKKSPMIRGCPKENFQAKLRTDGRFACVHGIWIPVCTCMLRRSVDNIVLIQRDPLVVQTVADVF